MACPRRRIRDKPRLNQRAAGALFHVGDRAFDKYERSLIESRGPTIQLLRLLDTHSALVSELQTADRQ